MYRKATLDGYYNRFEITNNFHLNSFRPDNFISTFQDRSLISRRSRKRNKRHNISQDRDDCLGHQPTKRKGTVHTQHQKIMLILSIIFHFFTPSTTSRCHTLSRIRFKARKQQKCGDSPKGRRPTNATQNSKPLRAQPTDRVGAGVGWYRNRLESTQKSERQRPQVTSSGRQFFRGLLSRERLRRWIDNTKCSRAHETPKKKKKRGGGGE